MNKFIFALLFLIHSFGVLASGNDWIELKKAKVKMDLPKDWTAQKDLMGIPLVIYSPMKENGRVTISITPTGLEDLNMDKKVLSDTWGDYKNGRLKWLNRVGGRSEEIYPYKNEEWQFQKNVHHVGHRYYLSDVHYAEHSYYVTCDNQMFHIKSLYRFEEYKQQESMIESVVRTFQCKSLLGATK